jgi:uncharacterized membrane protein
MFYFKHEGNPKIEHEHEHPGRVRHKHKHKHRAAIALSLLGLTSFAFILGFVHTEEIALLALVAGGVNPWILMVAYGCAVLLGLVAATIAGVKLYRQFRPKLARYEKYIPKISAGILVAMAVAIIFA